MSLRPQVEPQLETHERLSSMQPTAVDGPEGVTYPRGGRWGEQMVGCPVPTKHSLAAEGSYFVANTATSIVAACGLDTTYSQTAAIFTLFNQAPPGGMRIFFDYFKLLMYSVTTSTGVNSVEFSFEIDYVKRGISNGTKATPINLASAKATSQVVFYFADGGFDITANGQSQASRNVGRVKIPCGSASTSDEVIVQFGAVDHGGVSCGPLTAVRGQRSRMFSTAPPIILGPQQTLIVHRWTLTETGNSPLYEFEFAWWER